MGIPEKYWPVLVLIVFVAYRLYSFLRLRKMIPQLKDEGAQIVDVRSEGEFVHGNANGAINIPLNSLGQRVKEIDPEKPVILCCASGSRSAMAKMLLKRHGFKKLYNAGAWKNLS
jgi:rhodanese-related sulfurtransferase